MVAVKKRLLTTDKAVTLKQLSELFDDLEILLKALLISYEKRKTRSMALADITLAQKTIKKIESCLHLLELVLPSVSNIELKFTPQPLSYAKNLFAQAQENLSLILASPEFEQNLLSELGIFLIQIRDLVFIQTNNKTWDWAGETLPVDKALARR